MKILFLLAAAGRIRNFDRTIVELADRGHTVRVAGQLRKGSFQLPPMLAHERVSARVNPVDRGDEWRDFVDLLRGARDYVRYFDPRYAQATRLVRRAYEIAPTAFVLYCERHPWIKRHWSLVARALALCEDLIPTDPRFEQFLREEQPGVVVVTPLVTFESYQTDYVKAAHRLGLPVVFIPFSWDNLTNKGLMRIQPDRVLVWNNLQRQEAIDLHGCRPEAIGITGAARFDDFFVRTPSTQREQFCAEYGLDPARPLILYLGSSQLTGPNEMELVRRWAESIRAADDEALRASGILIRPHPALKNSWLSADFSDLGHVGLSLHARRDGDQELFDSLHHAHAAVGLNTSAMLEAAIAGTPVHTLLIPGFDAGQVGTMHFHYLVEAYGGLATVARDFAEHNRQLSAVIRSDRSASPRNRAFAEQFLRPHGIDQPVSPLLAGEIERAAALQKRPRRHAPGWHPPVRRALLAWLRRRTAGSPRADDSSVIATSMSLRAVRTALQEIQQATAPVFVGPWVDSVANELLYWIPFIRWASATYGIGPERLITLSCSGAADWYGSLAHRHLDARTLFASSELDHWMHRTVPQSEQDPKQAVISPFDQEIVDRATRAFDVSESQLLHPSFLFRVMRRLQKDRAVAQLGDVLRFTAYEPSAQTRPLPLPGSFVALSLGFTQTLPKNEENVDFLKELLASVTKEHDVVVVDAPPADVALLAGPRVHLLDPTIDVDAHRGVVQAEALRRARAFVGGYGDLAVLAAFCGTPVTAYHSERLPDDQVDRLQMAAATAGWGSVSVERARRFKGGRPSAPVHA